MAEPQTYVITRAKAWGYILFFVLCLAFVMAMCSETKQQGKVKDDFTYRRLAEILVKQKLRDPDSAVFSDMKVIHGFDARPTVVCGRVNARNAFGGMTGAQRFIVADGAQVEDEIGQAAMDAAWRSNIC